MESIEHFCEKYGDPLNFLFDSEEVSKLVGVLRKESDDLFFSDNGEREIRSLLDEILFFRDRGQLYQRWSQTINNKERALSLPNKYFKKLIDYYLIPLIKRAKLHGKSHGAEKGWSPRKSLETHVPVGSVLSFDLSSAFTNCGLDKVYNFFYGLFQNLEIESPENVSAFFSLILTVPYHGEEIKRGLPQGAPHGTFLFNRVFYDLDELLEWKSQKRGFYYTRWVDDITISSRKNVPIEDMLGAVELVGRQFPISQKKVYFQNSEKPVYLLGHVIDRLVVTKNSSEDREQNKTGALDYKRWFESESRDYKSWI